MRGEVTRGARAVVVYPEVRGRGGPGADPELRLEEARGLAQAMDKAHIRDLMLETAETHLDSALGQVEGHYMGEHWLASFALLALEAGR